MANTRDELVDRIARNQAPGASKAKGDGKAGARNQATAPWLKRLDCYHRRQPREYAVTRFG